MDSNNNSANMKLSPGMMCLVVGFREDPVNLGKVVTLKSFHKRGDFIQTGKGDSLASLVQDCWLVEGKNLSREWRCGLTNKVITYVDCNGIFKTEHLMPIRPEEDPLEITDVITKKEKA